MAHVYVLSLPLVGCSAVAQSCCLPIPHHPRNFLAMSLLASRPVRLPLVSSAQQCNREVSQPFLVKPGGEYLRLWWYIGLNQATLPQKTVRQQVSKSVCLCPSKTLQKQADPAQPLVYRQTPPGSPHAGSLCDDQSPDPFSRAHPWPPGSKSLASNSNRDNSEKTFRLGLPSLQISRKEKNSKLSSTTF